MTCHACRKSPPAQGSELCPDCQGKYGVPERWPESRRRRRPCARCGGNTLIRAIVRERGAGDWYSPRVAALGLTFRKQERPPNDPDLREPAGILEIYTCRSCGFSEWYVLEPERVPIGPEYATEIIVLDPFRDG
jgi:hypothetical protein